MFAAPTLMATLPAAASLTDVEYGRADGISLRMDAQIPPGPGPSPAVILVHGGGWVGGSRTWNVSPLFEPLNQAGFAWFSISYRLAKDFFHFGVAVADVRHAVHHVRSHASEYNIDPARIALLGDPPADIWPPSQRSKSLNRSQPWWRFTAQTISNI